MENEETFQTIRQAICRSLALEENEVNIDSPLFTELGMDSLDFLDVIFDVEKQCGVKLRNEDITKLIKGDEDDPDAMEREISDDEMSNLSNFLPALNGLENTSLKRKDLFSYMTVETLVLIVESKR